MDRDTIIEKLTHILRDSLGYNDLVVTETMSAKDVDTWDSLSHFQIIKRIEDTFSVKFKFKDLKGLKNVGDIIRFIESNTL